MRNIDDYEPLKFNMEYKIICGNKHAVEKKVTEHLNQRWELVENAQVYKSGEFSILKFAQTMIRCTLKDIDKENTL